ncbi:hypothetical protein [Bacillus cereus]
MDFDLSNSRNHKAAKQFLKRIFQSFHTSKGSVINFFRAEL